MGTQIPIIILQQEKEIASLAINHFILNPKEEGH